MDGEISLNDFITLTAIRTNRSTSFELILATATEKIPFSGTRVLKAIITFVTGFLVSILDQVSLILIYGISAFETVYFSF